MPRKTQFCLEFDKTLNCLFAPYIYDIVKSRYRITKGAISMIALGNNIKKARKEMGLTQEELAFQIGVTSQAVSRWESGVSQTKGY